MADLRIPAPAGRFTVRAQADLGDHRGTQSGELPAQQVKQTQRRQRDPLDRFFSIIPAGGIGSRLWPLSRASAPKFLHDLTGSGQTLLQDTWDRLTPIAGKERILVVTGKVHKSAVLEQIEDLSTDNLVLELSPKDSTAAIALAAAILMKREPDVIVGSFAADHVITEDEQFHKTVREAVLVAATGKIVTIGIEPTEPSVGFGYIKSNPMNINSGDSEVITYSQVTEDFNGNGKIVRKFSDYESNPDIGVDGVDYKYFQIFNYYTFDNPQLEKNSIGIYLNDMKIERGKIKWEKIYNSSNNLIEETLYDYNVSPGKFNLWTVSMHQTGTYSQSNKMYYYPNYLTKKTVKNYLNSSIVENVFEYEYDATNNNLLSEKHVESNSDVTETRYSYTYISQNNLRRKTPQR